jgi:hypothetical protein
MKYSLYRAKIEGIQVEETHNSYLVRITPHMDDIEDTLLLPVFPSFLKNTVQTYDLQDIVWVLSEPTFQVGYVIGLAENSIGSNINTFTDRIREYEKKFDLPLSQNKNIQYSIALNAFIDFFDKETGVSGKINNSGSCIFFTQTGEFLIGVDKTNASIKKDGISIESRNMKQHLTGDYTLQSATIIEETERKEETIRSSKKESVFADKSTTVLGNEVSVANTRNTTVVNTDSETVGLGKSITIGAKGFDIKLISGDYSVLATAGNIKFTSSLGINLTAGINGINLTSAGPIQLQATQIQLKTANLDIQALSIKAPSGYAAPSGSGPFCALPFCLFTGAPHSGNVFGGV